MREWIWGLFSAPVTLVAAMAALFWITRPSLPPTEEEIDHLLHDEDDDGPQS